MGTPCFGDRAEARGRRVAGYSRTTDFAKQLTGFSVGHIVAGCYPDPWCAGYVNEMPLQIMFLLTPKNIAFLKLELAGLMC